MLRILRRVAELAGVAGAIAVASAGLLAMAVPDHPGPVPGAGPSGDSTRPDLRLLLGLSGALRAVEAARSGLPAAVLATLPPGIHPTSLATPDGATIEAISLIPLRAKTGASWHGYRIGFWPGERAVGPRGLRYPLPDGFIEVTPQNQDLRLSTHFKVRDFLTHDQPEHWPKVLVIRLKLIDKLELIAARLAILGRPSALRVMSGFRTPQYNARGVGPLGGRAQDSRHMYGDAADIYVDADGDGRMDDLNRDGWVTTDDARWLAGIAAQVEAEHPELAGGIGVYGATRDHGPFVHVDTRGTPARW